MVAEREKGCFPIRRSTVRIYKEYTNTLYWFVIIIIYYYKQKNNMKYSKKKLKKNIMNMANETLLFFVLTWIKIKK